MQAQGDRFVVCATMFDGFYRIANGARNIFGLRVKPNMPIFQFPCQPIGVDGLQARLAFLFYVSGSRGPGIEQLEPVWRIQQSGHCLAQLGIKRPGQLLCGGSGPLQGGSQILCRCLIILLHKAAEYVFFALVVQVDRRA